MLHEQNAEELSHGELRPLAKVDPKRKAWAVVHGEARHVDCVGLLGDWAVTTWDGFATITHLPTGAACYQTAYDSGLMVRMHEALEQLQALPAFDLQTARAYSTAIHTALAKAGLL